MNNLQKAIELLDNISDFKSENIGIVYKALELASKTDWFYPSKNEFPKNGEMVYLALSNGSYKQQLFDANDKNTVDYFKNTTYVKAWTYLPSM